VCVCVFYNKSGSHLLEENTDVLYTVGVLHHKCLQRIEICVTLTAEVTLPEYSTRFGQVGISLQKFAF